MKGASDGGIFIPHNGKRFPGYDTESKELDDETLKKYIFGGHVAEYMESLEEEDDERCVCLLSLLSAIPNDPYDSFKKQFSTYLADGVGSEDMEEIYTNAYAAIREDPEFKPTEKDKDWKTESTQYRTKRLTYAERKERIQTKIDAFKSSGGAEEEEADEDEE
jgi:large subunit ribosomal protein L5e